MKRLTLALALLAACSPEPTVTEHVSGPCEAPASRVVLPEDVRETSGVASSRGHPGIFWTHNDSGGDSAVFAIDSAGTLIGRVRVEGAANRDWEDIAVASCEPGSGEECLFIGDIGDNSERRDRVVIYRIPEPDPAADSVTGSALRIQARYPDGPRDAEGLYVTDEGIHLVTKGRRHSVELYRLPPPYSSRRDRTLERIQELAPPPTSMTAQVTAAAATRDGNTVVLRSYSGLRFFERAGDTLRPLGRPADFLSPSQPQGEGVDFTAPLRLVLTGESGGRAPASMAAVRCDPRAEPPDTTVPGD